jgi:hypothetical protein
LKNIVLKFGLIAGVIVASMTAVTLSLCMKGVVDFSQSEVVGYTTMVLAFLMVFLGIRAYREQSGGAITFGKAFQVGILITLIASAVYVISWEIVYFNFLPDFFETYAAFMVDKLRASGASASEVAARQKEMADFGRMYKNPLFNIGVTFMEVFPVGLIVTLVSAGILRRKPAEPLAA